MAKISTYPIISIPTLNDLLIGTDVENLNETKNFSLGDIAALVISGNYVPYTGATQDVFLGAFNISANSFINTNGTVSDFLKADGSLDSTVYQPAGNYITSLTGEATASGPGAATVTLSNSAVIGKVLTGLIVTGGSVSATDSILTAFGKVQNQINGLYGGAIYQGTWNASTNTPLIQSGIGIQGYYYIVSVAGSTSIDGISDWNVGDWIIFDGTAWQQVDNTDTVVSVNGQVGVVVLTTTNISEGTNLYFTDSRARLALSLTTTGNSGASTYNNATGAFNIPNYTASGLGAVPTSRQLSINGTSYDLSADRSWSVGTVTSVGTSAPLTGGTITSSGTIGITQASGSTDGYLSSTDWTTFNNKQNALTNPVTGTGTIYYLPMWSGISALTDSILSYSSNIVTFNYNSASGGTVNYTNTNGTTYTYTIQMNNATAPRQTYHSYTDGNILQQINSNVVSKNLQSGQLVLPYYTTTSSFTGTSAGYLGFDASGNILSVAGVSSNIYTADGTLTSARTLTSGGFNLTFTGSNTASSAIARGILMNHTLVAAANNDVLVGLDINPTFTNGAFTGIQNVDIQLRSNGNIKANGFGGGAYNINVNTNSTTLNGGSGGIFFQIFTGNQAKFFSNGNLLLQNGGTFTDAGQRLQVTGTSILNGFATISGSTTAASLIARGALVSSTLIAAANNDVLVGLDIAPTFTNGAFTGVSNIGIRVNGNITIPYDNTAFIIGNNNDVGIVKKFGAVGFYAFGSSSDFTIAQSSASNIFPSNTFASKFVINATTSTITTVGGITVGGITVGDNYGFEIINEIGLIKKSGGGAFVAYPANRDFFIAQSTANSVNASNTFNRRLQIFQSTGNLLLQNGGTFTDAGFKLDVSGTARASQLTLTGSSGVSLFIASGTAIRGSTNGQTTYIDASPDLTGTLTFRATTSGFGTLTAGAFTASSITCSSTNPITNTTATNIASLRVTNSTASYFWGLETHRNTASGSAEFSNSVTNPCLIFFSSRSLSIGSYTEVASAQLSMTSTTKGFLPPRMTTTQKNAIGTPATGLIVYDTTLNKLCVRTASAWETITSV